MKEITDQEFENYVEQIIDGKLTLKELCKTLRTSYSTLNVRITNLEEINPDLYGRYIAKFPYKPKRNEQINSRGLIIEIMKDNSSFEEIHKKYGIPKRTIVRRIAEIKKYDKELYSIYQDYRQNSLDLATCEKISNLVREPVLLDKRPEELKKEEIELIFKQFDELLRKNPSLTKEKAAAQLGFIPQQMDEMRKKLNRINRETQFREQFRAQYHCESNGVGRQCISIGNSTKRECKGHEEK